MINGAQITTTVDAADADRVHREMDAAWDRGNITKGHVSILGEPIISVNPAHIMAVTTGRDAP
jgi:hypothetical protein